MSNLTGFKRSIARLPASRRLARDETGAAAVEFALVGPIFFLAVIGLIEVAMIILVSVLLEGGIRESARFGLTGRSGEDGQSRDQQIIAIMRDATFGLVELQPGQIETRVYSSFSDIGTAEGFTDDAPYNGSYDPGEDFDDANGNGEWDDDVGEPGSGGADDIVLYRVRTQWAPFTPLFAPFLGEDGVIELEASAAIRNEPF